MPLQRRNQFRQNLEEGAEKRVWEWCVCVGGGVVCVWGGKLARGGGEYGGGAHVLWEEAIQ